MVRPWAALGVLEQLFTDLNACRYLFLREISEPEENCLRLLVEEGTASPEARSMEIGGTVISGLYNIVCGENTRLFEIRWDSYVAYSIRNESYVVRDESEKFELGNLVRVFSESKFLEYVRKATIASDEYPGPIQHIEIISEMHIIDVISTVDPVVRKLRPKPRA